MALTAYGGDPIIPIGVGTTVLTQSAPTGQVTTLDAANEAYIAIGHIVTSDGGSHTIDTTGSSSIGWRSTSVTFSNGGTTVKVGLAAVDTAAGPPARAANTTDVINFDVSADFTGGGGGITANAWQTSVPTTGTKTIANGDLVAFAVQMTARGGTDTVAVTSAQPQTPWHRPTVTEYVAASYSSGTRIPNVFITFSDGETGYIHGCELFSTLSTRTWNSGSATKEYGQLYNFPVPMNVYGIYGWVDPDADFDVVLYSDPLGTPVAEKTISVDSNVVTATAGRKFFVQFASPYTLNASTNIGAVFKPGATSVSAYYKTLANAGHRVAGVGTSSYGISRASGAFANANSSLDHYYIGLLVGAFDDATGGGAAGGRGPLIRSRLIG